MKLKLAIAMTLLALLLLLPAALADDKPTVAILSFGNTTDGNVATGGILDVLESYGFISAEENRLLEGQLGYNGENINFIWSDAGGDFATLNLIVQDALDQEADVLVTGGPPATLAAIAATMHMEQPTPVLFTYVSAPIPAGIAQSTCIKPDHVTGASANLSYDFVLGALQLQNPDIAIGRHDLQPVGSRRRIWRRPNH